MYLISFFFFYLFWVDPLFTHFVIYVSFASATIDLELYSWVRTRRYVFVPSWENKIQSKVLISLFLLTIRVAFYLQDKITSLFSSDYHACFWRVPESHILCPKKLISFPVPSDPGHRNNVVWYTLLLGKAFKALYAAVYNIFVSNNVSLVFYQGNSYINSFNNSTWKI